MNLNPPGRSLIRAAALPAVLAATLTAALAAPLSARAHEGHGLPGAAHWHATDVLGFVALAVGVGALVWWRSRK